MEKKFDFGMIGLGVMGQNLLYNMADHGFSVLGLDLDEKKARGLEEGAPAGTYVKGTTDTKTFVEGLSTPRRITLLVPAGKPVDAVVASLLPYLEKGDIIIDGGNSHYTDTLRRVKELASQGFHFMGMGVSGGEKGARFGPSIMPGGDKEAYNHVKPLLEAISAKVGKDQEPCTAYMGKDAAGHFVKMVHNGIEYAIMEVISEVYDLLKNGLGYTNDQLHGLFARWNEGRLQSFLIEITRDIFATKDPETGNYLVDMILTSRPHLDHLTVMLSVREGMRRTMAPRPRQHFIDVVMTNLSARENQWLQLIRSMSNDGAENSDSREYPFSYN